MREKRVLAVLASPRPNGMVAKMLRTACDKAEKLGCKVTMINLYEQNIAYCKGCMACKKAGRCVIQDDVQPFIEQFLQSDVIIIASPTYFANVSAPLKNLFDRLVATVMDDNKSSIPKPRLSKNQTYLLFTACSTPFPFDRIAKQSTGCIRAMNEVMHISGMKSGGRVIFAGTRGKELLPSRIEAKICKLVSRTIA